jgi:23S rRNA (cytidine1920-2'-O)/16S rRNA (cytidine1409-2'-O)-methyltransferase
MPRRRLDVELVRRGLAKSREQAQRLIESREVLVAGVVADKPARQVDDKVSIAIAQSETEFASRGGTKLDGALDVFTTLDVAGKVCADIGASTGGFTDVLLRRGAAMVYAVDVGYGQLLWRLQSDPRVVVIDRANAKDASSWAQKPSPQVVTCDVSFISLTKVLPAIVANSAIDADLILMVKPQFEVGREALERGGVVKDEDLRLSAIQDVVDYARGLGLTEVARVDSPIKGPAGNQETFIWLRKGLGS